jgi:Flp pilus assembly protein TadG
MRRRSRVLALLRSGLACERGATAVEFALLALPFLALLMAMLETALVFFVGQVLQSATAESGRLVMTGQATSLSSTQFQQAVCDRGYGLFDCSNISVNVQTFSSFAAITRITPIQNGKLNKTALTFAVGRPGDIEVVQVFYPWPLGTDLLGLHLNNINGDSSLLVATSVFRNEPY